jgi:biopolymer transport protein ExbD
MSPLTRCLPLVVAAALGAGACRSGPNAVAENAGPSGPGVKVAPSSANTCPCPQGGVVVASATPLDLPPTPKAPSAAQVLLEVVIPESGEISIDGKSARDDDVLRLAREAREKNPEVRVVIKADAMARHGRVIRVVDLLKQGGVNKIAFGVTPAAKAAGP